MDKKINEISDRLLNLSISQERALAVCEEITQGFFDLNDDTEKLTHFDHYRIMADILLQYLAELDQKLGNLQRFIEK